MKKTIGLSLTLVLAIALAIGLISGGVAAATEISPTALSVQTFPDVSSTHPYFDAIESMHSLGIISGYSNGNFGPDDPVKRAQFAKMILGALDIAPNATTTTRFTDLGAPDANGYPHRYVQTAYDWNITQGTNQAATLFAPWNSIRRDQTVSMIVRGIDKVFPQALSTPPEDYVSVFADVPQPHGENLRIAEYNGLLDELVGFGAAWNELAPATRGEVAQMLLYAIELNQAFVDPIEVTGGYIAGTAVGDPANPCRAYRDVPYAAPPVGDLRWKAPAPVVPWDGIRQCTTFGVSPIQFMTVGFLPPVNQSEDSLTLNIITPAKRASEKLPVMVYFHGGGYAYASGNESWVSDQTQLPEAGVVYVQVNERLGALGLLCHPLLNAESGEADSSGNYLFLDLIQSLKWVQANIDAFGGDPNNVTIFGESGGGCKVSVLLASPLAEGLFHRAICQSGTTTPASWPTLTEEESYAVGEEFFENLGVTTLAQARAKSWEEITAAAEGLSFNEVVDGYVLEDTPEAVFEAGEQNAVPLIVSTVEGELYPEGTYPIVLPWILPAYQNMLNSQWELGVPSYAVLWDQVPANWRAIGGKCTHFMDVSYVVGDMNEDSPAWALIHPILGNLISTGVPVELRDIDRTISQQTSSLWAQFAKTGNPAVSTLVEWPEWDPSSEKYLYINDSLTIKEDFPKIAPVTP